MADMICTKCGREAVDGKRFCGACGGILHAAVAGPAQPQMTARFCIKCGAPYAPGKRFCKQCGHAIGTTAPKAAIQSANTDIGTAKSVEPIVVHLQADNANKPPPEEAATPSLTAVQASEPSQVLLSQAAPKSEQDQPAWSYSEENPNFSSIGRSFSRLTNLDRVEQDTPPEVQAEPPAVHVPKAITSDRYVPTRSAKTARRDDGVSTSRGSRTLALVIETICVMAVVVGIVLYFGVSHHWWRNPAPVAAQAVSPAAAIPPSAAGQPLQKQPIKPTAVARPPAAPAGSVSRKQRERRQAAPEDRKPPETAQARSQRAEGDNCGLSPNILPKMLDQAQRNREQGNYPAAVRQYRAVLACDRNNARARSGLETALLDIQHQ